MTLPEFIAAIRLGKVLVQAPLYGDDLYAEQWVTLGLDKIEAVTAEAFGRGILSPDVVGWDEATRLVRAEIARG